MDCPNFARNIHRLDSNPKMRVCLQSNTSSLQRVSDLAMPVGAPVAVIGAIVSAIFFFANLSADVKGVQTRLDEFERRSAARFEESERRTAARFDALEELLTGKTKERLDELVGQVTVLREQSRR